MTLPPTVAGFGPIDPLLHSPDVNEICVNGPGPVWIDAGGAWHRSGIELDVAEVGLLVERLLAASDRRADRLHPMVDARLADGSRVNVVVAPVTSPGPLVTIRRFADTVLGLEDFGDAEQCQHVERVLLERGSILVSGATGAGKTSFVSALLARIGREERVVVVEDTAELRLPGPNSVRLEAQPRNAEGRGEVTLRDLVRNSLRMRPDRIVVGEVRGPEALDLLLALNTGHEGSMATCHAASAEGALRRLRTLSLLADGGVGASAVDQLLAGSFDTVIHLERSGADRRISDMLSVRIR